VVADELGGYRDREALGDDGGRDRRAVEARCSVDEVRALVREEDVVVAWDVLDGEEERPPAAKLRHPTVGAEEPHEQLHVEVGQRPLESLRRLGRRPGYASRKRLGTGRDDGRLGRKPVECIVEGVPGRPVRVVEIEELAVRLFVELVPKSPLRSRRLGGGRFPEREEVRDDRLDAQRR
jgi:hypothetical protein